MSTKTEEAMRLADDMTDARAREAWKTLGDLRDALRAHLQAMEDAAQTPQPAQAAAWMTEDGERVIPVHTKAQAIKDGGATKFATDVYSVPLFRQPAQAGAVEPVLYQWCSDGLWINLGCEKNLEAMRNAGYEVRALYAHPPKAVEAVALTDDQIYEIADSPECNPDDRGWGPKFSTLKFARAILATASPVVPEGWTEAKKLAETVLMARSYKLSIPSHESEKLASAILAMEAARQGGKAS